MTEPSSTVHRLDLAGADRLTSVLMKAFEIGDSIDPLNPHRAQLKSLGPSLEHLFEDLRREIAALSAASDAPQPGHIIQCQTLERLSAQVSKLMDAVRTVAS
ncbi:hypothetical protein [Methylobacterium sp. J-076]|uniref:hypothetical protein n=1 Tax=Methylobacterium sp. J-076 TaxID=2836655 RepID=UPI001FBB3794|nr:hypothetical protein [Methylobacterium sp. J-076]MCJ2011766.1 hypothetical protein [Methylobacterium sp. J-076]